MSSAFDLLRSFGDDSKKYLGFKHLAHGNHEIVQFRLVKNKMYKPSNEKSLKLSLLVELSGQVLFLPGYFAAKFQDADGEKKVEELNNDGMKKYLFFGGTRLENK